jgi:hypothetical protein
MCQAISAKLLHHPGQSGVHISRHQMTLRHVTTAGPTTLKNQGVSIRGIQSIFSPGPWQVSLLAVADHDTNKATLLTPVDWNPILDNGCPKSSGGLENVISLSMALGIPVHLSALDCAPFHHGYGEACSDERITIGIWNLLLVDLNGVEFRIPFYVFLGSGPLLLGNSVLRNSRIDGPKHLFIITKKDGLSKIPLILQTYTIDSLRTHLHVIPCRTDQMCTLFQSVSSFTASAYYHR